MLPLRDLNPSRTTPWVTWSIMLACVLVFIFEAIQPLALYRALMASYALVPARVSAALAGDDDPLVLTSVFTSMFMHGGLLHIVGNLWYLRVFGDNVEDRLGHVRYMLFYLLCGVAAAATQWLVDPYSEVPMVGASGAIAGVLAAYLVLFPRARVLTLVPVFFVFFVELPAFVLMPLWFVLQFFSGVASLGLETGGGVAYWAHIGGFVAGLGLVFLLRPPPRPEPRGRWRVRDAERPVA
jgi:hypothetical protein